MSSHPFRWACPACKEPLLPIEASRMRCPRDGVDYYQECGIWRMLTAEEAALHRPFVRDYDRVRNAEQWGAGNGDYYRALPYSDLSGRHSRIWHIRAASFDALRKEVVVPLAHALGRPLRVLDAGAGNGWLSYRLALEDHELIAADLRTGPADGLGACSWYMDEVSFNLVQAAFEQLPLFDGELDLVVFNGSLHYAVNYEAVLAETLRVLGSHGRVAILDSPMYSRARSGQQMVDELYDRLRKEHQIEPGAIPHENYLTPRRLQELARRLQLSWRIIKPFYGWRWALAPWLARLRGRRQPARFYLIVGEPCS